MDYDHTKYTTYRSLGVPYKLALALASDTAPVNVPADAVDDATDTNDIVAQFNALLASLRAAGVLASDSVIT